MVHPRLSKKLPIDWNSGLYPVCNLIFLLEYVFYIVSEFINKLYIVLSACFDLTFALSTFYLPPFLNTILADNC